MNLRASFLAAVALLTGSRAAAEDENSICADRPGLATPTCTVPAGRVQVEAALADWTHDNSTGFRSDELGIGQTAVKFGLTDRVHVEVGITPYSRLREQTGSFVATASGFGDVELAAKYRLTGTGAVQVALRCWAKVPTATRQVGNGKWEGGLIVPVDYALPGSRLSIGLSPELDIAADHDGYGHHLTMTQVLALGLSISRRANATLELAGSWDLDPAGTLRQYALGGSLSHLLSKDLQIDAGLVLGLNRAAPDVELYSGIAFRF